MEILTLMAATAGADSGLLGALGIDLQLLIMQLLSFLILYYLLKKLVFPHLFRALDKRQAMIDSSVEAAKKAEVAAAKSEQTTKAELDKAKKEAADIVELAQKEAADIVAEAEIKAGKKTEHLIKQAEARLESDLASAKQELRGEIGSLVALATEKIIDEKLDAKKDAVLIKKALDSAAKGVK